MTEWDKEEVRVKLLGAKMVAIDGRQESSRVPIQDVMDRTAWFPLAGIYRIYDGSELVYVGRTSKPLRSVLYNTIQHRLSWARGDWRQWHVTVQADSGHEAEDRQRVWAEVQRHQPRYNKLHRPKSAMSQETEVSA